MPTAGTSPVAFAAGPGGARIAWSSAGWYVRLGCGQSDRDAVSLIVEDDVGQLEAVLDDAGIDRCDLVGSSFGGPGAALFATRQPERVRRLVPYST